MGGCLLTDSDHCSDASHQEFVQTDILDRGPNDGEATGLRRKHVDLISALAHIAEKALNSIGGLNVSVHRGRKRIKRQQVLFVLSQTSYCFWIALTILGFEGRQLYHCFLLCWLVPDANQFGLDLTSLSPGDGVQDVALLVHQTALTRRGRKLFRDSCQQSVMTIGHDQIHLCCPTTAQIL